MNSVRYDPEEAEAAYRNQWAGPLKWIGCALVLVLGYILVLGPGIVLMPVGIAWGAYLLHRQVPGGAYAAATLAPVAIALLAAWAIF